MRPLLKDPVGFYDRAKAALDRAVSSFRHVRPWLYIGLLVVAGWVIAAVTNAFGQWAQDSLIATLKGIWWLLNRPLWMGGAGLVGVIAFVVLASWWETRPRLAQQVRKLSEQKSQVEARLRESEDRAQVVQGEEERRNIQFVRTVWNRYGSLAASQLDDLLSSNLRVLKNSHWWGKQFESDEAVLRKARENMEEAVADRSIEGFEGVRLCFNSMMAAYRKALDVLAGLEANGPVYPSKTPTDYDLARWRESHEKFIDKLRDVWEEPEMRGQLATWFNNPSPALIKLLEPPKASETSVGLTLAGEGMTIDPSPSDPK
jgi:hypothetical protein